MASDEPISLDELFSRQAHSTQGATVEPVDDDDTVVKVTPWQPGMGCLCHLALTVPRDSIETVTPTGDTHFCCGKRLPVVTVTFRDDAQLSIGEVYAQLERSAVSPEHGQGGHGPTPGAPAMFPESGHGVGPVFSSRMSWRATPQPFQTSLPWPHAAAPPPPPGQRCWDNYYACQEGCRYDPCRMNCECECSNERLRCLGSRLGYLCPDCSV